MRDRSSEYSSLILESRAFLRSFFIAFLLSGFSFSSFVHASFTSSAASDSPRRIRLSSPNSRLGARGRAQKCGRSQGKRDATC